MSRARPGRRTSPLRRAIQPLRWLHAEWRRRARLRRGILASAWGVTLAAAVWHAVPVAWARVVAHSYFALETIELDGNRRLARSALLDWAGIHPGTSIWLAPPGAVRARLESHRWIRRARVRREFPNRLRIALQERHPVAIVRADTFSYVDRAGHVLGPLRTDDSRDFPIITGFETEATQEFAAIGIRRALQLLRRCERLKCFDGISEVHVDPQQGITIFPRRMAVAVMLGWGSWRQKLVHSARVFAVWEGQVERLAVVDASFRGQVVVRLRAEKPAGRAPKHAIRV
jgi:cell division protein FtsQ